MGLCFQSIPDNCPGVAVKNKYILENGYIWVVGRRQKDVGKPIVWHLQGIATNEKTAVQMCADQDYFIGPVPLNTALPHNEIEWAGSYFPLKNK